MTTLRLPTSPLKPSVLQEHNLGLNSGNIRANLDLGNSISALLSSSKPVQVLTASADSTGDEQESENCSKAVAGKKKGRGGRKPKDGNNKTNKNISDKKTQKKVSADKPMVMATTASGIPFVKHHHSVKKPQTPSVSRRNARERNRVKQVNSSFSVLRDHIPNLKSKTSKVDTLRAAVEYIQTLRQLCGEDITDRFTGPVLITDQDDDKSSLCLDDSGLNSSSSIDHQHHQQQRPLSSLSGDINPMVYQLPPKQEPADITHNDRGSSVSPVEQVTSTFDHQDFQQQQSQDWWGRVSVPVTSTPPSSMA